jgi:hypothetical protein
MNMAELDVRIQQSFVRLTHKGDSQRQADNDSYDGSYSGRGMKPVKSENFVSLKVCYTKDLTCAEI